MKAVKKTQKGRKINDQVGGKQAASLRKGVGTRFAVSLLAVLLAVYVALEWKSYEPRAEWDISMNVDELLVEPVPVTKVELKLPPPPAAPDVIEIAPDDDPVIETLVQSSELNRDEPVLDVSDIRVDKVDEEEEIPFSVVDEVPVFPGCEDATDKQACFNEKMQEHVKKIFRYPEPAQEMRIQGRVSVLFTIQKDGSIGNIQMRGPDRLLETEALRIIEKLPAMTPGKQHGRPVRVPFSIPIVFRLAN